MSEQDNKPPARAEDEIGAAVSGTGAKSPALERLTQVANDMTQLEFKLLKTKAKAAAVGGDSPSE